MTYRLYRLDARHRILGGPDYFEAADDEAALSEALRRPHPHLMELWTGERFVGLVRASPTPLRAAICDARVCPSA